MKTASFELTDGEIWVPRAVAATAIELSLRTFTSQVGRGELPKANKRHKYPLAATIKAHIARVLAARGPVNAAAEKAGLLKAQRIAQETKNTERSGSLINRSEAEFAAQALAVICVDALKNACRRLAVDIPDHSTAEGRLRLADHECRRARHLMVAAIAPKSAGAFEVSIYEIPGYLNSGSPDHARYAEYRNSLARRAGPEGLDQANLYLRDLLEAEKHPAADGNEALLAHREGRPGPRAFWEVAAAAPAATSEQPTHEPTSAPGEESAHDYP